MNVNEIMKYVEYVGKIISVGLSLYAIIWSLITIVKAYSEKIQVAVKNKDWEQMIEVINEFVLAAEQKFVGEKGSGKKKKEEVISLLELSGYKVNKIIDALIESIVYKQFNADKEEKINLTYEPK